METRHSLTINSPQADRDDWGVRAAREYIKATMQGFSDRLDVSLDCYMAAEQGRITEQAELCNVMAVLPGRRERRVYVSGHYDTVARREDTGSFDWTRWENPAPGANDDGSGTVLTMELARIFRQSGLQFDATQVFIGFVAEEEGLVGASLHSQRALDEVRDRPHGDSLPERLLGFHALVSAALSTGPGLPTRSAAIPIRRARRVA